MGNTKTGCCCLPSLVKSRDKSQHELVPTEEIEEATCSLQDDDEKDSDGDGNDGDGTVRHELLHSSTIIDVNLSLDGTDHELNNGNHYINTTENYSTATLDDDNNEIFIPQSFETYDNVLNILFNETCCIGIYDQKLQR